MITFRSQKLFPRYCAQSLVGGCGVGLLTRGLSAVTTLGTRGTPEPAWAGAAVLGVVGNRSALGTWVLCRITGSELVFPLFQGSLF